MNKAKSCLSILISMLLAGSTLLARADVSVVDLYEQTETPTLTKSNNVTSELVMQLDQMQETMRQMRGELELQQHQLQQLHQTQLQIFQDLDKRVQALTNQSPVANSSESTVQSFTQLGHQTALPATASPKQEDSGVDETAYHKAYAFVEKRQYTQATTALQSFLSQYPDSKFIPNAHYWLGELYGLSGQSKLAIVEFNTVAQQFPQHTKAADALLKMGYLYYDQAQWADAQQVLKRVVSQFPNTSAAQLATQRLTQLGREGHV